LIFIRRSSPLGRWHPRGSAVAFTGASSGPGAGPYSPCLPRPPQAAAQRPADELRTDKRKNIYVVLSRNFWKRHFASLYYNFIDNQSNTELYDYEKHIYGFSVGAKF
jgi:hypothetical protein